MDTLGVPPEAMVMDPLGRPNHLLNGEVISPLYTGQAVEQQTVTGHRPTRLSSAAQIPEK